VKSYLRLLFVGSVFLVLLGLFNEPGSDRDFEGSESDGLEQTAVQSALLPLDPIHDISRLSSTPYHPEGKPEHIRRSQETHRSRLLTSEIQICKRIRGEISPDLLQRTGYFIVFHSGSEIPS